MCKWTWWVPFSCAFTHCLNMQHTPAKWLEATPLVSSRFGQGHIAMGCVIDSITPWWPFYKPAQMSASLLPVAPSDCSLGFISRKSFRLIFFLEPHFCYALLFWAPDPSPTMLSVLQTRKEGLMGHGWWKFHFFILWICKINAVSLPLHLHKSSLSWSTPLLCAQNWCWSHQSV